MILEDIAVLFESRKEPAHELARKFGRERKFVYSMKHGCGFHCDVDFICGLYSLGYELKLERIKP